MLHAQVSLQEQHILELVHFVVVGLLEEGDIKTFLPSVIHKSRVVRHVAARSIKLGKYGVFGVAFPHAKVEPRRAALGFLFLTFPSAPVGRPMWVMMSAAWGSVSGGMEKKWSSTASVFGEPSVSKVKKCK